jgi:WXG100 family type VII secretion target
MADGSRIAVQWAAMEDGSNAFASAHAQVQDTVTRLKSTLASTLGAEWVGSAQGGWQDVQTAWNSAQTQMAEIHAALKQVIDTSNINYQTTEAANLKSWS